MVHRAGGVGGLRLFEGLLNEGAYQETIKDIHTRVVRDTVPNLSLNRVLVRPPPRICQAESRLPHSHASFCLSYRPLRPLEGLSAPSK